MVKKLCPDRVEFKIMEEVFEIRNGYVRILDHFTQLEAE